MKKIVLLALLFTGWMTAQAQEIYNSTGKSGQAKYKENQQKKGFDFNRMVFGGGLGLTFGTITNIYVAPSIGYRITDKFAAGVTLGYNYYRQKDAFLTQNLYTSETKYLPLSQSIYSGSIWGKYIIIPNIMVQAEFELNNLSYYDPTMGYPADKDGWPMPVKKRVTVPSLLLGAGYRQPIGEYSSIFIMAFYDVLQDLPGNTRTDQNGEKYSISPYADRVDFRVGFTIGF
ncbi:hypothetical protein [Taibaiella koreensis]|uniref:hypothetical protein n=1 Tax=Taibaiella koreensis TaxID=1268548 RepID=UPI000E59BEC6|nr:hypothetical protein [Taibaiella koreensis]